MDDRELAKRFNNPPKSSAKTGKSTVLIVGFAVFVVVLIGLAIANSDSIKMQNSGIKIPRMSRTGNH